MQYVLWFGQFLFIYSMILLFFRLWKKEGLLVWTAVSVIFANIQVVKLVSLFGLDATLGNALYVSSFFATDAISEFYGKSEARKAMYLSLSVSLLYLIFGRFAVWFRPLEFDLTGHQALTMLFTFTPRIIAASFVCYFLSQTVDIHIFHYFTQKKMPLWSKNLFSTLISQAVDSFLFVFIAFWGAFEGTLIQQLPVVLQIAFSTFLIKTLVNILDIPFLYGMRSMFRKLGAVRD